MCSLRQKRFGFWASFVLLTIFLALFFFRNSQWLYLGHDGQYFLQVFKDYLRWGTGPFVGSWDPLQCATGFFSFDGSLVPGIYPFWFDLPLRVQVILSYLCFALELYLAVYVLLRTLGMDATGAVCTGWATVFLLFPTIVDAAALGGIFLISPLRGHALALSLFALCALLHVRWERRPVSLGCAVGFILLVLLLVNTSYMMAASMFPMLAVGVLFVLGASENKADAVARGVTAALALGAVLLSGAVRWELGQVLYGARFSLNPEFVDVFPAMVFTSLLLQPLPYGKVVVPLAVVGGIFLVRSEKRLLRLCGYYFLLFVGIIALMGVVYYLQLFDMRKFYRPVYIEYSILALYPMAAAYALAQLFLLGVRQLPPRLYDRGSELYQRLRKRLPEYLLYLAASVAVMLFVGTLIQLRNPKKFPFPVVKATTLTRRLSAELAIEPGKPFRGRCVSFLWTGAYSDEEIAQGQKPKLSMNAAGVHPALGNIHMQSNLWAFGIPTIEGVDQATTLPFYLTFSRAASAVPWIINHSCISRFNIPLFQASGIRFVITPRQVTVPGLKLAAYVLFSNDAVLAEAGSKPGEYPEAPSPDRAGHFLYEISDVNLGAYSPVELVWDDTLAQALARISSPAFDYARTLQLFGSEVPKASYVPADSAQIEFRRGAIKLTATSSGSSILLLPFNYSRTMRWVSDPGTSSSVRIVRADVYMTAIVFEKKLSGTLWMDAGFGQERAARLDDYKDMLKLKILEVPRQDLTGDDRYI